MEERRRLERFDLRLPATLQLNGGTKGAFVLFTKNISAGGVLFDVSNPNHLPRGERAEVSLLLDFSKSKRKLPKGAEIKVSGSVLRSEPTGLAMCFDEKYRIISSNNSNPH